MSGWCTAPAGSSLISSTTNWLDCQAQTLGSGAWSALAMPGSTLSVVLTGFLTIFIAIIGYNLLFGRTLTVREGTLAAVKIGFVFALATSWPAYRTLVYDLVIDGPSQLVAEIGPSARVVGSDGSLLQRLDGVDQAMAQLAILGPGNAVAVADAVVPPPFGGFDAFALGGARILYLIVAVAALGGVRVIAGLMLALGPFFIAFLLFDNTRGLFESWIRVLGGAALAAVGVALTLGLQLAMLEPWLAAVLARRMAGEALPTVSVDLFVYTCLFAILTLAAIWACLRLMRGFRFAPVAALVAGARKRPTGEAMPVARSQAQSRAEERSRAAAVASLIALSRREAAPEGAGAGPRLPARLVIGSRQDAPDMQRQLPLGRSHRRRVATRASAAAGRRDGMA